MRPRSLGTITVVLLALTPAFMAKQPGSIDRTEKQRPVIEFASNAGTVDPEEPASTTATIADVTVGPNGTSTFSPSTVSIVVGDTVRWT